MSVIYIKTFILSFFLMIAGFAYSQENLGLIPSDNQQSAITDNSESIVIDRQVMTEQYDINSDVQSLSSSNSDIIILLENTPGLSSINIDQLLTRFTDLGATSYVGLMKFNDQVSVIQALAASDGLNLESIRDALMATSDTTAPIDLGRALERAIYELKYNGQMGAEKKILLITNPDRNNIGAEIGAISATVKSDITDYDIKLHLVAFSETAMNNFAGALSGLKNLATYFAEDETEMDSIVESILTLTYSGDSRRAVTSTTAETASIPPQVQQAQTQSQINTTTPTISPAMGEEEKARTGIFIISAIILIITLGALIVLLYLRIRKISASGNTQISEAYLKDIHGYTSNEMYHLGKKATMLGRVAGKDSENLDYIVIPETTIGRRHAVIEYKDYAYWITDQGSINGTFINNIPISSEVRLKQGDIVRLHKYEFEFSIPELDEAGMTKISNTVLADHIEKETSLDSAEIEDVKETITSGGLDLDFGFGDTSGQSDDVAEPAPASDETLLPGHNLEDHGEAKSGDETLMPTSGVPDAVAESVDFDLTGDDNQESRHDHSNNKKEDETLMPGYMDGMDDEDETIRPSKKSSDE